MCTFLTFATPLQSPPPLPPDLARELAVKPFANAGSGHSYRSGLNAFSITKGGCSCGLLLAARRVDDGLRRKYEGRGWSSAKIERALADHASALVTHRRGLDQRLVKYLDDVVRAGRTIELIGHDHHGAFSTEPFEVAGPISISLADFNSGAAAITFDVRYTVTADRT